MNLQTIVRAKLFIVLVALLGGVGYGIAQNKEVKNNVKTTEGKAVQLKVDGSNLLVLDNNNTKPVSQTKEFTDIFTFLTDSEDHAILVRAIKVTGLKETLEGKGRFTAFAPNDAAFNALGDEVLESLFKAENRAVLKEVISYHVMPGSQGVNELTRAVNGNGGEARLKTLNGSTLNVRLNGDKVVIVGANGAKATIVSGDKVQNNGMVHTINTVVMPN
ncbi:fasciclin domain-containing protein [Bizionia paragorgiae]|uniref:fasciclin domain-containing protein n=1 Tax=Bizionia paragorgiae TaxID=283786 RepID=UPI003A928BF0